MLVVGELVKWRKPTEECYSYGYILELRGKKALIRFAGGYYSGSLAEVYTDDIKRVRRGTG